MKWLIKIKMYWYDFDDKKKNVFSPVEMYFTLLIVLIDFCY